MADFSNDVKVENEGSGGIYSLRLVSHFNVEIALEHIDAGISYESHLIGRAYFPEYVRLHRAEIYQDYQV